MAMSPLPASERLTRTSGVRKTYDKLGLPLSKSSAVMYCQCPELCAQYKVHPFGRLLVGEKVDLHNFERAEKEVDRTKVEFTYPAAKELVIGYRQRRANVLVAQGMTACSNRTECYITPLHFAKHQDGVCVLHAKQPTLCQKLSLAPKGENPAPFANLVGWTPEARPFNFSFHYKWEPRQAPNATQAPSPAPRSSSTARSHKSPTPHHSISKMNPPSPASSSSSSSAYTESTAPVRPTKRARSTSTEAEAEVETAPAQLPFDKDIQDDLRAEIAAANGERDRIVAASTARAQAKQLARNEQKTQEAARQRLARAEAQALARMDEFTGDEDPVRGWARFEEWAKGLGGEVGEGGEGEGVGVNEGRKA